MEQFKWTDEQIRQVALDLVIRATDPPRTPEALVAAARVLERYLRGES